MKNSPVSLGFSGKIQAIPWSIQLKSLQSQIWKFSIVQLGYDTPFCQNCSKLNDLYSILKLKE